MAIVVEGDRGRVYLEPNEEHEQTAAAAQPAWGPDEQLAHDPRNIWCVQYGLTRFRDLFTRRQLATLTTFSDLRTEATKQAIADGASQERADAIALYLAFAIDKASDRNTSLCVWEANMDRLRGTFGRQALPMVWDYGETNPFAGASGDLSGCVESLCEALEVLQPHTIGTVRQIDATSLSIDGSSRVFCTDPPYYDNIAYSDLSDFFYVWLRHNIGAVFSEICSTLLVPKKQELVATPYRFGGNKERAREFFQKGFSKAFDRMHAAQHREYPLTVYYAFKQSETDRNEDENETASLASTGWETMLEGLLSAQFQVTGTWPMRSELQTRNISRGTNALASSIVLVCRPRSESAPLTTRKDFIAALKRELGPAIRILQAENIPAVDLQQAAIGPGMAIFSRYKKVIESDGTAMRVRVALGLINQALDELLSEQESDYDAETRWALAWFEQNQFNEGQFGDANTLANAKALSVEGMERAGVVCSRAGKVRLLKRNELPEDWDPAADSRLTVWEVTQHLIRILDTKGQDAARELAAKAGGMAETARELAYRLYTLCERKGWAEEAGYYNSLVAAWPAIRTQEFALTGRA